ncbi:YlbL family protein [Aeromicrobium duanguangcaii]|uniref:YlbL family protein n=1 Tax=Aeromicrobium duanguangcaii TaxID=2968086 RepID=UPI002017CCD7|nr:PDZ domain-containing protein [Aeromicrobium duanguangcaii]
MASPMRLSRRTLTLTVGLSFLTVLTCLVAFLPVPYVTMRPGPVFNTLGDLDGTPMLTFGKGVRTYPTDGRLDFTTVSVTRAESRMSLSGAIEGWLDPNVAVVPHDFVYPDRQTNEQSQAEGAAELASSQDASRAAALKAAGFTVKELPKVAQVVEKGPAEGKLEAGDLILTVDGRKVDDQAAVGEAISARKPGTEVTIGYRRDGKDGTATITTTAMPDDPKKARVGISVGTGFEFPIEIENNIGDRVGGPSAGTMFALAIYDELTPGPLTGGQNVAGTGTIDPDGNVGAIGGVRQKMAGAAKAGADVFLVPAQNCQEATDGGDFDMTLVKVEKLQDAIDAVGALAKNPKTKVASCE